MRTSVKCPFGQPVVMHCH